jgi:choline transport protein
MPSGGSVSFVYGFIFCVICNICLSASVGELASLWPTAGGQYHYAYAMASDKWKKSMVSDMLPVGLFFSSNRFR